MKRCLAALLALAALPAVAAAGGPCRESATPYDGSCAQAVDLFAWDVLADWKVQTLEATRRLGPVLDEQVRAEPNEYLPGQSLEIRTLRFDGLLIEGRIDGATVRPRRVEIESPRWRVRGGLGVGCPVAAVRKALGSSASQVGPALEYQGLSERVAFTIAAGKVARVVVTYYTG